MTANPQQYPADRERDAIRIFMKNLGNRFADPEFETDACTFKIGGEQWLFSTDEFSAEDNFRSNRAYDLGWNVAAATISDILAAGGLPVFYAHAVTLQNDWDEPYIEDFSKGIAKCLETTGAEFLGGDMGMSGSWKYTGIAIGKKTADLNRNGAREGDLIYMTGQAGAGNLEAALMLYSGRMLLKPMLDMVEVVFPVRIKESALVRKYANCCIDSSDGVFRALQDISRISRMGFRASQIPYHSKGQVACKLLSKPEEMLFLGECGEYELVFTISPQQEKEFLEEARSVNLEFARIGVITGEPGQYLVNGIRTLDLTGYSLFARNYEDVNQYITDVIQFIKNGYG
jgi:thiamine-monophosphate kinase